MKKSEIVELIAETLEKNFDGNNGSWHHDAEKVLEAIQEAGMRPPYDASQDDEVDSEEWEQE